MSKQAELPIETDGYVIEVNGEVESAQRGVNAPHFTRQPGDFMHEHTFSQRTGETRIPGTEEPVDVMEGSAMFAQSALARAAIKYPRELHGPIQPENDYINRRRRLFK
jgi:hypothetical protein